MELAEFGITFWLCMQRSSVFQENIYNSGDLSSVGLRKLNCFSLELSDSPNIKLLSNSINTNIINYMSVKYLIM